MRVRSFLRNNNYTRSDIDEYLSHAAHVAHMPFFLLTECRGIWPHLYDALRCDFTVVVYDRFNLRRVTDASGIFYELPETEPLCVEARLKRTCTNPHLDVQLLLYCNTHRDGTGWHYEWISASEEHAQDATHVSKSGAESSSAWTGHPSDYVPASLEQEDTNMDGPASARTDRCSDYVPSVFEQLDWHHSATSAGRRSDDASSLLQEIDTIMDGLASAEAYQCSECGPSVSDQVPMSVEQRSQCVPSVFEQMGMVQEMDADRWENAGSDEEQGEVLSARSLSASSSDDGSDAEDVFELQTADVGIQPIE